MLCSLRLQLPRILKSGPSNDLSYHELEKAAQQSNIVEKQLLRPRKAYLTLPLMNKYTTACFLDLLGGRWIISTDRHHTFSG